GGEGLVGCFEPASRLPAVPAPLLEDLLDHAVFRLAGGAAGDFLEPQTVPHDRCSLGCRRVLRLELWLADRRRRPLGRRADPRLADRPRPARIGGRLPPRPPPPPQLPPLPGAHSLAPA